MIKFWSKLAKEINDRIRSEVVNLVLLIGPLISVGHMHIPLLANDLSEKPAVNFKYSTSFLIQWQNQSEQPLL